MPTSKKKKENQTSTSSHENNPLNVDKFEKMLNTAISKEDTDTISELLGKIESLNKNDYISSRTLTSAARSDNIQIIDLLIISIGFISQELWQEKLKLEKA